MWSNYTHMGAIMALYGLIWLVVVAVVLIAMWRAMKAHEAIAAHLASIARSLGGSRDAGG